MSISSTHWGRSLLAGAIGIVAVPLAFVRAYCAELGERYRNLVWNRVDPDRRYLFIKSAHHYSATKNQEAYARAFEKADAIVRAKLKPDSLVLKDWEEWLATNRTDPKLKMLLKETCEGNCVDLAQKILAHQTRTNPALTRLDFHCLSQRRNAENALTVMILQIWNFNIHKQLKEKLGQAKDYSTFLECEQKSQSILIDLHGMEPKPENLDKICAIDFLKQFGLIGGGEDSLQGALHGKGSFQEILSDSPVEKIHFSGCVIFTAGSLEKAKGHAMMLYVDRASMTFMLYDNNRGYYRFRTLPEALEHIDERFAQLYHFSDAKEVFYAGMSKTGADFYERVGAFESFNLSESFKYCS